MLTVVVTASISPLNPSAAILRELLLSLKHLQLPIRNQVLVSHDGPRLGPRAYVAQNASAPYSWNQLSRRVAAQQFPEKYLGYLANVAQMLPAAERCTGLSIRLLVRATNGNLAGNLAFALAYVRTPFMLKVEHDHPFTRKLDAISIVHDMMADRRLKYIRFNRRENIRVRCDNGDYYRDSPSDRLLAMALWGPHEGPRGMKLQNAYSRTACFSDMNHLTSTDYYRNLVLPIILRPDWGYPKVTPENLMQDHCYIVRNHTVYGTYIYDAVGAPPTIAHVDAALRGVGEVLPQVRVWLQEVKQRARNGTADPPFACEPSLDLRPPSGLSVSSTYFRKRDAPAKRVAPASASANATTEATRVPRHVRPVTFDPLAHNNKRRRNTSSTATGKARGAGPAKMAAVRLARRSTPEQMDWEVDRSTVSPVV